MALQKQPVDHDLACRMKNDGASGAADKSVRAPFRRKALHRTRPRAYTASFNCSAFFSSVAGTTSTGQGALFSTCAVMEPTSRLYREPCP